MIWPKSFPGDSAYLHTCDTAMTFTVWTRKLELRKHLLLQLTIDQNFKHIGRKSIHKIGLQLQKDIFWIISLVLSVYAVLVVVTTTASTCKIDERLPNCCERAWSIPFYQWLVSSEAESLLLCCVGLSHGKNWLLILLYCTKAKQNETDWLTFKNR